MREIVLIGAGRLGRMIAARLEATETFDVILVDSDPAKHTPTAAIHDSGVPCCSLEEAIRIAPNAEYGVTIWGAGSSHRIRETEAELRRRGIIAIVPLVELLRRADLFPHYAIDDPANVAPHDVGAIATADHVWSDTASTHEYLEQLSARRTGRFDLLPEPTPAVQYFGTGLFTVRPDEIVVDAGAFDGDSLRSFITLVGPSFYRWIAFEPDPTSRAKFLENLPDTAGLFAGRVEIHPHGLGASNAIAGVAPDTLGTVGSHLEPDPVSQGNPQIVSVMPLDAMNLAPTIIKLDIEGMELEALAGAMQTIQRARPVVIACLYHRQADLWEIPNMLQAQLERYSYYLRAHGAEGWELVLYAIPQERIPR